MLRRRLSTNVYIARGSALCNLDLRAILGKTCQISIRLVVLYQTCTSLHARYLTTIQQNYRTLIRFITIQCITPIIYGRTDLQCLKRRFYSLTSNTSIFLDKLAFTLLLPRTVLLLLVLIIYKTTLTRYQTNYITYQT